MKIVPRAIQVNGQQEDGIEAILPAVGLGLDEHHLLGQAIRRVCFFRITVPEIVFLERDRRKLGIRADRAKGNKFVYLFHISFVKELHAHHDVFVKEGCGILLVESDAAHLRREVDHNVGVRLFIKAFNAFRIDQVVLREIGNGYVLIATFLQLANEMSTKETLSTGNRNALIV